MIGLEVSLSLLTAFHFLYHFQSNKYTLNIILLLRIIILHIFLLSFIYI